MRCECEASSTGRMQSRAVRRCALPSFLVCGVFHRRLLVCGACRRSRRSSPVDSPHDATAAELG
jgi:hypothetical protein